MVSYMGVSWLALAPFEFKKGFQGAWIVFRSGPNFLVLQESGLVSGSTIHCLTNEYEARRFEIPFAWGIRSCLFCYIVASNQSLGKTLFS